MLHYSIQQSVHWNNRTRFAELGLTPLRIHFSSYCTQESVSEDMDLGGG